MAEILCPACGKPNPDDRSTCQFCEAPLPTEETPSRESPSADGKPIHPGDAPVRIDTSELEPVLPQWLREARQQARAAAEEKEEQPSEEATETPSQETGGEENKEEEIPDWLAGLDAQREEEDEELPDWLASVQADIASAEDEESSTEKEEPPAQEAPPPSIEGLELQEIETGELPDWLSDLQSEQAEGDEIFQFPTAMTAETGETAFPAPSSFEESPSAEESGAEEPLSWPEGLAAPEEGASPEGAEGLPDWLETEGASSTAAEGESVEEEIPAWLRLSSEEEMQPAVETGGEEELPGWLADAGAQPEATSETPSPSADEEKGDALPDWLTVEEVSAEEHPKPPLLEEEGETLSEQAAGPVEAAVSAEEVSERDETLPDWLSDLREAGFAAAGEAEEKKETAPAADESAAESAGEAPEWLETLPAVEGGRIEPTETGTPPFMEQPSEGESVPAFVMDEGELDEEMEEIFAVEMPDWLSALSAEKEEEPPEGEEEGELSPAELPDWVQAMRPVEAVVPEEPVEGEAGTVVAETGPLAGLTGVLPARPGFGPLSKPRPHALKLQVTRGQQASASLLDDMLQGETAPRSVAAPSRPRSRRLLRWVLTALLFLVLAVPVAGETTLTPLPALRMAEIEAANGIINRLPPEASALVVFDYDPALSAEVETAAAPVIDHLMVHGARIVLLSTSPLGSHLAERVLSTLRDEHGYRRGEEYVNLGYLAGETSGILGFAADPVEVLPATTEGTPAWDTPPLRTVRALSDFDLIILLTDDAGTARAWIEQTASYRGETPLVTVISAQAEPMVRPYYEAGQVQGMVTGLYGGAYYERLNGLPGASRRYMDAFSLGTLVAAIALGLGGAWSLLLSRASRHEESDEE